VAGDRCGSCGVLDLGVGHVDRIDPRGVGDASRIRHSGAMRRAPMANSTSANSAARASSPAR